MTQTPIMNRTENLFRGNIPSRALWLLLLLVGLRFFVVIENMPLLDLLTGAQPEGLMLRLCLRDNTVAALL